MEYEYDVFLSYCRSNDHAIAWTRDVFYPTLRSQLHLEARMDRVFFDGESLESGDPWPDRLRDAVLRSRQLVAVLSPQYFESDWCRYELGTFLRRQTDLGVSLVWPLEVFDGETYPEEFKAQVQMESLESWSTLRPGQQRVGLDKRIKDLARRIRRRDADVPRFDPAWRESATCFEVTPRPPRVPF